MNHGLKVGVRTKLVMGVLALAIATASHAAASLVNGGATLPAIGYVGAGAETNTQVISPASGSLFFQWASSTRVSAVSYCQTGSGAGKNVLTGVATYNVQNTCPTDASGNHGFGANATGVGRSDLVWPDVVGSDSPLSTTDLSNFSAHHSSTYLPVQIPVVAGAVSIALNKTTTNGVVLNTSNTNFSDLQICEIFSGTVTDWSDSRLASAFTLGSGDSIPAGTIKVQYRSDGSGTTFSLANHLSAAGQTSGANECSSLTSSTKHFVTDQSFVNAVAEYLTPPSTWTGSSGNPAVAKAIANTAGSFGYVETANSLAQGISFAKLNGVDPSTFGATVSIGTSNVVYNSVINGANSTTGRPVVQAIAPAPTTQCIALVSPDAYANAGGGILGISNFEASSQGNSTSTHNDAANVRSLLWAPYNSVITGAVTSIGPNTGLAFLSNTGITQAQVSGCIVN